MLSLPPHLRPRTGSALAIPSSSSVPQTRSTVSKPLWPGESLWMKATKPAIRCQARRCGPASLPLFGCSVHPVLETIYKGLPGGFDDILHDAVGSPDVLAIRRVDMVV